MVVKLQGKFSCDLNISKTTISIHGSLFCDVENVE